jgi:hypothetical protein
VGLDADNCLAAGCPRSGSAGWLLRTVGQFNPDAARARDPQINRGDTLVNRYFGASYPRLGKNSPDARFPAAKRQSVSPRRSVRS